MFNGLDSWDKGNAVYLAAVLLLVLASSAAMRRQGVMRSLGMVLLWIAIIGAVAAVANRRGSVLALLGERDPAAPQAAQGGAVRIAARDDGHFWVEARVGGEPVRFLVDSGASDIVLTRDIARRLGIDVDALRYDRFAMTANGMARGASVELPPIDIGGIVRTGLPAAVAENQLDTNLLGMRYLRSLRSWKVEGDTLTLQP